MSNKTLMSAEPCSIVTCCAFRAKQGLTKSARNVRLLLFPFAMLFLTVYGGSLREAVALATQGSIAGPDTQRIEVTLDEFSISPNPLRIPAGQPVTLVVRNVGKIPHEFMAGREAKDNDFEHDLFAGLHVNIRSGANSEAAPNDQMDAESEAGHHGGDHEHGTMVEPEPGQTVYMDFTLPETKRGEWSTACFLPGHYPAGMHGTVIVE